MSHGVVYYNAGTSHLVRLLVSLQSLRRWYQGPVTVLSEKDDSSKICFSIAERFNAQVTEWDCGLPAGKNRRLLAKTCYYRGTPYETTIAIDADTVILGPMEELFCEAERSQFCVAQIGNWRSNNRIISRRLEFWRHIRPGDVDHALRFGPAINCGIVAFQKDAEIFSEWLEAALPGRNSFIPDEVCCQLIIYKHPHKILDRKWNCSCKYDNAELPDTRIIHYHGDKHCRLGLPFQAWRWVREFDQAVAENAGFLKAWMPAGDTSLCRYLKAYDIGQFSGQPIAARCQPR
jgi:hypothetical protein